MASEVESADQFGAWWEGLDEDEQESVYAGVIHRGRPYRVLYAFDPRRAILLIGGDKTGHDRWYEQFVPLADRLYDQHLETLKREGLI